MHILEHFHLYNIVSLIFREKYRSRNIGGSEMVSYLIQMDFVVPRTKMSTGLMTCVVNNKDFNLKISKLPKKTGESFTLPRHSDIFCVIEFKAYNNIFFF